MIDKPAKNVKNNVRVDQRKYDDSTRAREEFIINMHTRAQFHDIELTGDPVAAAYIQNCEGAFTLYGWLARYIEYASDVWPDRNNDITFPTWRRSLSGKNIART